MRWCELTGTKPTGRLRSTCTCIYTRAGRCLRIWHLTRCSAPEASTYAELRAQFEPGDLIGMPAETAAAAAATGELDAAASTAYRTQTSHRQRGRHRHKASQRQAKQAEDAACADPPPPPPSGFDFAAVDAVDITDYAIAYCKPTATSR